MKIIYRISDSGYNKVKPDYINNESCLANAVKVFDNCEWSIIADNISEETNDMIQKYKSRNHIHYVEKGNGAATFNIALDEALEMDENDSVYFLENDYLHKPNSKTIIEEGLQLGANFVSLYDHPDKYMVPSKGGNPYCDGGAENTRVYLSENTHWKVTNSTTMTFASTIKNLKECEEILRKWTSGTHPDDFRMFIELQTQGKILITPIPGYATHGETRWLSPLINWREISVGF